MDRQTGFHKLNFKKTQINLFFNLFPPDGWHIMYKTQNLGDKKLNLLSLNKLLLKPFNYDFLEIYGEMV